MQTPLFSRRTPIRPVKGRSGIGAGLLAAFIILPVYGQATSQQADRDEHAIETRLRQTVEYLASDELQGRGPNTEGIEKAADYIAKRMGRMGLKTNPVDDQPYQVFYARVMNHEDDRALSQINGARVLGDLIYNLFVKIGDASPGYASSSIPMTTASGSVKLKNVAAMLEGEGPLADETIVIGAHYDHLGMRKGANGAAEVYHGANDNASGTAVMLEAAAILAHREKKLHRRVVFVAFSGEESGMLGSFHYVNHPPVALAKTIAMINLDVVGRMEGDRLMSIGTKTSPVLPELTEKIAKNHKLTLEEIGWIVPMSDHAAIYSRRIPVVFFLTWGGQGDYHRPSDTAETLNYGGMAKIAEITADLAVALAEAERRPEFAKDGLRSMAYRDLLRFWGWLFD
jgi:hypothetical protein